MKQKCTIGWNPEDGLFRNNSTSASSLLLSVNDFGRVEQAPYLLLGILAVLLLNLSDNLHKAVCDMTVLLIEPVLHAEHWRSVHNPQRLEIYFVVAAEFSAIVSFSCRNSVSVYFNPNSEIVCNSSCSNAAVSKMQ